ncbi:IPT/TIG domain-containing protein [Kitasatospora sp. NPDC050463]|uniref:IPT/TIG domain-containing protein n=1 Tax=Kitasatospora sp. NPDC050463 TaxID=3155786 RepID=UPI003404AF29
MPISPNQGSTGGGTTVTITGTSLAGATAVRFGSKLATITANTATSVTCISPSGAGTADVTVTTAGGTSSPLSFFYVGAPFKAFLSATSGPMTGGHTITIAGTGLFTATAVTFGATSVTPTVISDSHLDLTSPAATAAGEVSVSVTTAGGTNNGFLYTYIEAPVIASLTPDQGTAFGGTDVAIAGSNLTYTDEVRFGDASASFAAVSDNLILATAPPGIPGTITVTVHSPGGNSNELAYQQYPP